MVFDPCLISPAALYDSKECLDDLSKDLKGELTLVSSFTTTCEKERCETLHLRQTLTLEVAPHECDSDLGSLFNGVLRTKDLTTLYADGSPDRRGIHTATFSWAGAGVLVRGRLQGMTNVGTHREPFFEPVQRCKEFLVMEGRLCGYVSRSKDPRIPARSPVIAAYRFRLLDKPEAGGICGTLEGSLVRFC